MSKSKFSNIKALAICTIGAMIIFNRISKYHNSASRVARSETAEKFDLHLELGLLKASTPRVVKSLSILQEAGSSIDDFIEKCKGQIHPHYFYKITKGENKAYLLGTNHAISSVVFSPLLYKYLDASTSFFTEVQMYLPESSEEQSKEEVVYDAVIGLPDWCKKLSIYAQHFLTLFFKEKQVSLNNSYSPEYVASFLQAEIQRILQGNDMDQLLAKYVFDNGGKLGWLENQEDRDQAALLLYKNSVSSESDPSGVLTEADLYYIKLIDLTITSLVDGSNYCYAAPLLRKILGINSLTYDTLESIRKYLIGDVDLDRDLSTDQRTLNWLPGIKLLLNDASEVAFIAVGVQHVIGENGLVKFFEEADGYEATNLGATDDLLIEC